MKNIIKLEIIVTIKGNTEVLRITYVIQNIMHLKKFLQFFHNRSNCDYHFIINELAEEFKKQFTYLEETLKNT